MIQKLRQILRCKKGQGLVEYGILVGGIALVCLAATAILGNKTSDLIATTAAVLPGANPDDNGPIVSGQLVRTTESVDGSPIALDPTQSGSIGENLGIAGLSSLIVHPHHNHDDHDHDDE